MFENRLEEMREEISSNQYRLDEDRNRLREDLNAVRIQKSKPAAAEGAGV